MKDIDLNFSEAFSRYVRENGGDTQDASRDMIAACVKLILQCLNQDPSTPGLHDTPERVARALQEMTSGYDLLPEEVLDAVFEEPHDSLIICRDIPFNSLCEHHLLPFHGTVTLGYLPDGQVVGLSKIPRLVQLFAHRLQIQERLTNDIAMSFAHVVKPQGVAVITKAVHTCMCFRGVRSSGEMVTSCMIGALREDGLKNEFLRLANL